MKVGLAVLAVAALLATAGCSGGGSSTPSGPFEVSLALSSRSADGLALTIQGSSDRAMSCTWKIELAGNATSKTLDDCAAEVNTMGEIGRYDVTVTATDHTGATSIADCRFSYPQPEVHCMTH